VLEGPKRQYTMSIFRRIQRSRKAAKEHKDKQAETKKAETEGLPYRHVPTHAALDAINLAPASWKKHDKIRIIEENRRRSALMSAGVGGNVPAAFLYPPSSSTPPRVNSALSIVAYPADGGSSTPPMHLPRPSSYAGHSSLSPDQRGVASLASRLRSVDVKGKKAAEPVTSFQNMPQVAHTSLTASPIPDSGFASTSNSIDLTSSSADLEMKPLQSYPVFRCEVSASP
jgi:hypothetical protein